MTIALTGDGVRAVRTQAQHLTPRLPRQQLVDAVRAVVGIQGQLAPAMQLALRARVSDLELSDVIQAIAEHHSLVRTWAMRGTLHLLAAEDVGWMIGLIGTVFAAKDERRRLQLGIDASVSASGLKAIRSILEGSEPLTRHELREKLVERGVNIEPTGQALIHLIAQAALEGIICLGADRANGDSTYVLLNEWIKTDRVQASEDALSELARRYLTGYAPANQADFAGWCGLTIRDATAAWGVLKNAGKLVEVQFEGRSLWSLIDVMSDAPVTKPVVRLLPALDAYLLGYRNREAVVAAKHQPEVYHGGQTVPVVLVDGLAAGVWRYERAGKRLKITVQAFQPFNASIKHLIDEEADDIGRFWKMPVTVTQT